MKITFEWYHYMILISAIPLVFFIKFCSKYRNPYKLIMIFGKKGSGKTTLITKLALKALKRTDNVYCTIHVPGTRYFNPSSIGKYNFPPESIVFIDEVGMIWDNRDYKNFRPEVRDWFKLQRHNRVTVYLFSQTFDVDVKLRNLTDYMYLTRIYFNVISVARKIKRGIIIVNPDGQNEARIADSLQFESLLFSLLGLKSVIFTWVPSWSKYFDSFSLPDKAEIPYVNQPPYQSSPKRSLFSRLVSGIKSLCNSGYRCVSSLLRCKK